LPNRHGINGAYLPMAIGAGMTSAIMNPVRNQEMEAIRAANLLMNHDPNGMEWIKLAKVLDAMKEEGVSFAEASAAAAAAGGGRRGGRRRRG
ncbi:MAG: methyltetrahydrofolate cobalamin methyltransferase, partial [Rhodobacteraceae bacterium]